MIGTLTFQLTRIISIALFCTVLSACATTQRSSTSAANQVPAPTSEAGTQRFVPLLAPPNESAIPTVPQDATPSAPQSPAKADESGPMEFPIAERSEPAAGGNAKDASELTGKVKQQLAEQDSEINKIRQQQQDRATRMDKEAAPEAAPANQAAATPAAKTATAAAKEEDALVFPERKDTAAPATQGPSSIPMPIERSVYFNYDDATVLDKYDALLLANSAYVKAHPDLNIEVQGNCDERGSREYNLALGARRAETVKRALELGGADGTRIHTVSFGKEKPVAMGQDQESYSRNRRADIVY